MPKKRFSKRELARIKKAGLPEPNQGTTEAQFARLQKQWYAKLKQEADFEDIEWVNHNTGKGHNSAFLKHSLVSGKKYHPGRDLYYQLASNYLIHCTNLKNRPYEKFIWRLHAEGRTYEEVLAAVHHKYPSRACSIYTLFYQLKTIAKQCYRWNATAHEGLLVKRAEDQAAIEQSALAEFVNHEYNWMINEQYALQEKQRRNK